VSIAPPVHDSPPRSSRRQNLADLAAQARAKEMIGTVISKRYRIVELIAMGGVGAVYLGEHVHMHKHVAIKLLHPDSATPDLVPRFEREAVAGAHIQHPNVAAATDFGELEDGSFFLVLEYVRGITLREVIKRGPIPAGRAVRITKQIAAALAATHAMGIVHRDVKPRNVMLIEGERDVVKLIDFGLAKLDLKQVSAIAASRASAPDQRITGTGAVFGTIAYLAPEAGLGMDLVDARADIYALGVVLYEMLAGKHPFDSSDPVELFRMHHRVKPPPFIGRAPEVVVPPPLEAVVMKMLAKAPGDRYESAEAVIAALDAAIDVTSPTPPPVLLGEGTPIFPGPSILPPPPSSMRVPAPSIPSNMPPPLSDLGPASTPQPAVTMGPQAAPNPAPPAAAPLLPKSAPPPGPAPAPRKPRALWPYALVGAALTIVAAVLLVWPAPENGSASTPASASVAATSSAPSPSAAVTTVSSAKPASAPSASATAAASSAPAAGADAVAARTMLRRASGAHDWVRATEAFFALAEADPASFHDPSIVNAARDVAAAAGVAGGEQADRIFAVLGTKLGSDGLDVLYEIVRTRGGSKAAARAEEILRKPEVLARATPALRVTFEFREAACPEKAKLLDRAVAEGDGRTLLALQSTGVACLGRDPALAAAMKALKQKIVAR
jgi:serine/threonine-protein kinase